MPGDAEAMRMALQAADDPMRREDVQTELETALKNGGWRTHPLFVQVASQRIATRLRKGMVSLIDPRHLDVFRARARPGLYTFQKLANDTRDVFKKGTGIKHALIIVDEFHYLNDKGMPGAEAVRRALTSGRDPQTTWCVGMTATPGETRAQVANLLNAVAGRAGLVAPGAEGSVFPAARGLLSIARLESDGSRFARVKVTGMCARLDDRSPFSREYVRRIVSAFGDGKSNLLANEPLLAKKKRKLADSQITLGPGTKKTYMKTPREWTNFLELGPDDDDDNGNSANGNNNGPHPGEYTVEMTQKSRGAVKTLLASPKIAAALSHIRSKRGKHYVFSNSTRTLQILATLMQRELGMTHYNPSQCGTRGGCRDPFPEPNPKAPAFITLDEIGTPSYRPFDQLLLKTKQVVAARRHIMQAFDSPSNYYGDEIKVVLATKESFKGVDLKGVRYIHLMEPFVEFQDFIQLVGRGPRLCSHAREPSVSKRLVDVFVYRLVPGKGGCGPATDVVEAADCFVYDHALRRYLDTWGAIDDQMDQCAVDSKIFGPTLGAAYRAMFESFKRIPCAFIDPLKITKVRNPGKIYRNRMEKYSENGGLQRGMTPPGNYRGGMNTAVNNNKYNRTSAIQTATATATLKNNYKPPALWEMFKVNKPPTQAQLAKEAERARKLRQKANAARRKASPVEGYEPLFKMMERGKAGSANRARLARNLAKVQDRVVKERVKARKRSPVEGYEPLFKMMERGKAGSANRVRLAKELAKVQARVAKARKKSPVEGYEPLFKMMERGRAGSANRVRLAKELAKVQQRVAKERIQARKKSPVEGYQPLYKLMERGRAAKDRVKARKKSPVDLERTITL
jgi:hypothetical protein